MWTSMWERVGSELGSALRSLRRRPGFAATAVVTLGLGLGTAVLVFATADRVLFRPLPFVEPDRAVTVWISDPATGEERIPVLAGDFALWSEHQRTFSHLGLAEPYSYDVERGGRAIAESAWLVTPGFLAALGLPPRLGRGLLPEDADPERPPVVVVSDGFWKRALGGDPDAVGSTVTLDGAAVTVVGVLPPVGGLWPLDRDLFTPRSFRPGETQQFGRGYMSVVGRLAEGVSVEQAHRDLARVDRAHDPERRPAIAALGVSVVPLAEHLRGEVRPAVLLLLGAVGLLLLVVCANVAGLLLARGVRRADELAVRAALGAGRLRILALLLTENAVVVALGGVLGVGFAAIGLVLHRRIVPVDLPGGADAGLDLRVLAFAVAATVAATLVAGLLPALRFAGARGSLATPAKTRVSAGPRERGLRRGLIVLELATTLVLLVGAGLLTRTYAQLLASEPGFGWRGVAGVQTFLYDRFPSPPERLVAAGEILERIRALPGVAAAGVSSSPPFLPHRIDASDEAVVEGRPEDTAPTIYTTVADRGSFETLGIPLLRGRGFLPGDGPAAEKVALVNEAAADLLFPGEDPVGRRATFGVMSRPETWRIVGVVGDVRPERFDSPVRPEAFVPLEQSPTGSLTFLARGHAPEAILPLLSEAVWEVDPGQSVYWSATMADVVAEILAPRRYQLILLGVFAALTLFVSAVGLYGLISFSVLQRRREVGVRMALGAGRGAIARLVLREGLVLAAAGAALGLAAAAALSRTIRGFLYGVGAVDPATYLALGALVLVVGVLAAAVPAWRCAAIDPARALRGRRGLHGPARQ